MRKLLLILLPVIGLAQTTNYPSSLDSDTTLFVTGDNVQSTLTVAMTTGSTTATVSSGTGFAINQIATICDTVSNTGKCTAYEHMLITGVASNVLTVTRAFAGTSARSHAVGKLVSILIDAAHQKVLKDAVIAIETALGPNLSNIGGAILTASNFVFTPQSPGGTILAGITNTITLTPVPLGVNGTDVGHNLYLSTCSSGAQKVLITGGTAVGGASSGTITFTPANSCTAGWAISTATGGVAEAQQHLVTAYAGSGIVQLGPTAATFHAAVNSPGNGYNIMFRGMGSSNLLVLRGTDFLSGSLFKNSATTTGWYFRDLGIQQQSGIGTQTGAAIEFASPLAAQFISHVDIFNGQYGIKAVNTTFLQIDSVTYTNVDMSYQALAGFYIGGTGSTVAGNTFINNSVAVGAPQTHANSLEAGLWIAGADGIIGANNHFTGQNAVKIDNSVGVNQYIANIQLTNTFIDGPKLTGVQVFGTTSTCTAIQFNTLHNHGQHPTYGAGYGFDVGYSNATNCDDITVNGGYTEGYAYSGVAIGTASARSISFTGHVARDNNRGNNASNGGFLIANGVTGVQIIGCPAYNSALSALGHQKYGIITLGTLANSTIVGNALRNNETGPMVFTGAVTTSVIADNTGVESDTSQSIASANTITLGVYSFYTITGTTVLKTMNGGWTGRRVRLFFNNAAPVGIDATGNFYYAKALNQNEQVDCVYNGTKWACVGP